MQGLNNFSCGLCKKNKVKAERQKIILYDIINNDLLTSDICNDCFKKLSYHLSTKQTTEKGQESLDSWGLNNEN